MSKTHRKSLNQERRIRRVGKNKSRLDKYPKVVYDNLDSLDDEFSAVQKTNRNITQ
jgi:hypothetical protein